MRIHTCIHTYIHNFFFYIYICICGKKKYLNIVFKVFTVYIMMVFVKNKMHI